MKLHTALRHGRIGEWRCAGCTGSFAPGSQQVQLPSLQRRCTTNLSKPIRVLECPTKVSNEHRQTELISSHIQQQSMRDEELKDSLQRFDSALHNICSSASSGNAILAHGSRPGVHLATEHQPVVSGTFSRVCADAQSADQKSERSLPERQSERSLPGRQSERSLPGRQSSSHQDLFGTANSGAGKSITTSESPEMGARGARRSSQFSERMCLRRFTTGKTSRMSSLPVSSDNSVHIATSV
jgi:hypothetical protein